MAKMSGRTSGLLFLAILLAGVGRIALTYPVFSATIDENEHIEAGLEYWQLGRYLYEPQHPPLARAVLAAGAYFVHDLELGRRRFLDGEITVKPVEQKRERFESLLWADEWADPVRRRETLTAARAGNLAFWVLMSAVVFAWAWEALGRREAWAAAAIAACSPTLLAHAGLATLDLAAAATATAAVYAFWRWTRSGGRRDLCLAGAALGLTFGSKLSLLVFLPPALLVIVWTAREDLPQGTRSRLQSACMFLGAAAVVLLAIYRFNFGTIGPDGGAYVSPELWRGGSAAARLGALVGGWTVPAPALFRGVIDVVAHNSGGHYSYLLGEWSQDGSLLYFPVALAVKMTLPFLALTAWGIALLYRGGREDRRLMVALLALPAAVLAAAIPADINIGIRHVLPMFPCLAILAAVPFRRLHSGPLRWLPIALLVWHGGESLRAHPEYLSYFNQIALLSEKPILLDSNYDWGQDYERLAEWIEREGVEAVIVNGFGDIPLELPDRVLPAGHEDAGWFAVSSNIRYGMYGFTPEFEALMKTEPEATLGRTIHLYRIDPRELPALVPPQVLKRYAQPQEAP